jgi:hypothetical protein
MDVMGFCAMRLGGGLCFACERCLDLVARPLALLVVYMTAAVIWSHLESGPIVRIHVHVLAVDQGFGLGMS